MGDKDEIPTEEAASSSAQQTATVSVDQLQSLLQSISTMASTLAQNSKPPSSQPTVKHPDRPQINLNSTEGKWAFFQNDVGALQKAHKASCVITRRTESLLLTRTTT